MKTTKILPKDIRHFFGNQNFVIVSTIDKTGSLHNSCKGVVKIDSRGGIYLLDLYRAKTFNNLRRNPKISITAVDEHRFIGYCLKGKAKIITADKLGSDVLKLWDEKLTSRITHRLLKNIRGEKGHSSHPEVQLPKPEYMIYMQVSIIINLTPHKLK